MVLRIDSIQGWPGAAAIKLLPIDARSAQTLVPNISMVITSFPLPRKEAGRLNTLINFQPIFTLLNGQFSADDNTGPPRGAARPHVSYRGLRLAALSCPKTGSDASRWANRADSRCFP